MGWSLYSGIAPVLVVSGHAVELRFDLGKNGQCFIRIGGVLYDVPAKTDKIWREGVDLSNHAV